MDLKIGNQLSEKDIPKVSLQAVFILDRGTGDKRTVAKVSIAQCVSDHDYLATILCLDPRTGNRAPADILAGANVRVKLKDLHFIRT